MSRSRIFSTRPLPICLPIAQECLWGALPLEKTRQRAFVGARPNWQKPRNLPEKIMLLARIRADPMQPARAYRPSASLIPNIVPDASDVVSRNRDFFERREGASSSGNRGSGSTAMTRTGGSKGSDSDTSTAQPAGTRRTA